jgi:hypothetical protein
VDEIWPVLAVKVVAPFDAHLFEEERAMLLELTARILKGPFQAGELHGQQC